MPLQRRKALLSKAQALDALIIEDDYEFEMSFLTPPSPALKSLDEDGRVIYVGSFSKSLFPGLRLGYLVGSAAFICEARALRAIVLRHPPLPELFLVMATQNPLEQEGTYPLPEAQLDRFLMLVLVDYPQAEDELQILQLARQETDQNFSKQRKSYSPLPQEVVFAARQEVLSIYIAPELERYLVELILATRKPQRYLPELASKLQVGASPRGTIALDACARSRAWLQGRDFVSPDDVQEIYADVLRHRILLSYEAEADGWTADQILQKLLQNVPVP